VYLLFVIPFLQVINNKAKFTVFSNTLTKFNLYV